MFNESKWFTIAQYIIFGYNNGSFDEGVVKGFLDRVDYHSKHTDLGTIYAILGNVKQWEYHGCPTKTTTMIRVIQLVECTVMMKAMLLRINVEPRTMRHLVTKYVSNGNKDMLEILLA